MATSGNDEIETLLQLYCAEVLDEPDPALRYMLLTREQATFDALADLIRRRRGRALAEMARSTTKDQIADETGLGTRQRVQELIEASFPSGEITVRRGEWHPIAPDVPYEVQVLPPGVHRVEYRYNWRTCAITVDGDIHAVGPEQPGSSIEARTTDGPEELRVRIRRTG
ncbi:hypothetical protein Q0Z83_064690 [Actinoplanes sichuanensis]|uniref:Uncharacterized protein n=1 Tax=Actinoplanes sichuanensis TaxID=512349 RepID=A0ABW4ANV8_9ACTN|nr:hypothetical protein [Actinoplanes sichuanensis]BEL08278.1 hypothetical protein Q0Z83_064690 [Actinoplanes sichuanensis]